MSESRKYQLRAIAEVRAHWASGMRSVCLVAPTGAGKTHLGEELIADSPTTVWVAHRRELITQTAERLRARFGSRDVGIIMPGEYENRSARIVVATVQTLIARGNMPKAERLVLDEAIMSDYNNERSAQENIAMALYEIADALRDLGNQRNGGGPLFEAASVIKDTLQEMVSWQSSICEATESVASSISDAAETIKEVVEATS